MYINQCAVPLKWVISDRQREGNTKLLQHLWLISGQSQIADPLLCINAFVPLCVQSTIRKSVHVWYIAKKSSNEDRAETLWVHFVSVSEVRRASCCGFQSAFNVRIVFTLRRGGPNFPATTAPHRHFSHRYRTMFLSSATVSLWKRCRALHRY